MAETPLIWKNHWVGNLVAHHSPIQEAGKVSNHVFHPTVTQ